FDPSVGHESTFNAQNGNICNFNGDMHGGKEDGFAEQLQTKEVNVHNSGSVNKGVVQASSGRNSNRKNTNSNNKGSGNDINDGKLNDKMAISKGKSIMEVPGSGSYNQENGIQPSSIPNDFTNLSKAIGCAVESGRFTSEASTRGSLGNAKPFDRDSDRENIKGGSRTPNDGGHCPNEKSAEPSVTSSSACT
ncbi:hypothetical protein MKX03_002952, partial [Papaver bracteatum]